MAETGVSATHARALLRLEKPKFIQMAPFLSPVQRRPWLAGLRRAVRSGSSLSLDVRLQFTSVCVQPSPLVQGSLSAMLLSAKQPFLHTDESRECCDHSGERLGSSDRRLSSPELPQDQLGCLLEEP